MKKINCLKCSHFYVTHRQKFTYGCNAFGVISKINPYLEVRKISGTDCALFSIKEKNANIYKKKGRLA